jgi:hypothetical protein
MAALRWNSDNSVELQVTGAADEVESVTQRLAAGLGRSQTTPAEGSEASTDVKSWWTRSRKAWAFTVGLATVVGAVAAVLALVVH